MNLSGWILFGNTSCGVEIEGPAVNVIVIEKPVQKRITSQLDLGIIFGAAENCLHETTRCKIGFCNVIQFIR